MTYLYQKKIVFVDSTSSCELQNHCVTFLLTPCTAGAASLGVIITHGQSDKAYKSGFSLIKNNVKMHLEDKAILL